MYLASIFLGKKLVWDKTAHDFPTTDQLSRPHRRLGELLQSWQAVDADKLAQALEQQATDAAPLGQVLIANGWLDEETLAEAISYQANLQRTPLTRELVKQHAGDWPAEVALRLRAVHVGRAKHGEPLLAVATPLNAQALAEAAQHLGAAPVQRIARDSEVAAALDLVCQSAGLTVSGHDERLGQVLVDSGAVDRRAYELALSEYRPDEHGRIGDFLVERGVILRDLLEQALETHRPVPAA
jgi:adsorption protein B